MRRLAWPALVLLAGLLGLGGGLLWGRRPLGPSETPIRTRVGSLDVLREHSRRELAAKLASRGFDPAAIATAIDALAAAGLQSDARFAEQFVYARLQRGSGPLKIRAELRERGLADDQIGAALDALEADWLERMRAVREKKFGPGLPGDFRERARQVRFLQQRGFSGEQIGRLFRDTE